MGKNKVPRFLFIINGPVEEPNSRKVLKSMYKKISYLFAITLVAIAMSSCRTAWVPKAVNTVHPVGWEELNLVRKDYIILNTATAEASVTYYRTSKRVKISDANNEYIATFKRAKFRNAFGKKDEVWYLHDVDGIVRIGFLNNDYDEDEIRLRCDPSWFSRRAAIYRIINAAKVAGADGIIEPVISTNIEQVGRNVIFKTTVSGKLIKLKPDTK